MARGDSTQARHIAEEALRRNAERGGNQRKPTFRVSAKCTNAFGSEIWMQVGKAWQQPDGKIIVQMLTIPLPSSDWDGGLVLFPWEDDG